MFAKNKTRDKEVIDKVDPNKNDFTEMQYNEKVEDVKENTSNESIKTDGEYPYTIELWDVWGSTSKKAVRFGAKRYIDKGNVFLVNEKRGFIEPFPEDSSEYKQYKIEEVLKEIKKKEDLLTNLKKTNNPQHSERDLREDLKILKSFKRSLEFDGKGSYMLIDSDQAGARPLFMFDRRGNYRLPVFKNVDISLLYIPTEAKITEASDLIRENDIKNGKSNIGLMTIGLIILLVILVCAGLFFAYKTASLDLSFVEVLKEITVNQEKFTEQIAQAIETINSTKPNNDVVPNLNVVN